MADAMVKADLMVRNEGSIFLLSAQTPQGQEWIEQNIDMEEVMTWGDAVVVEHRFIDDIIKGAEADGLLVGGL
jgi:hypothetical protein